MTFRKMLEVLTWLNAHYRLLEKPPPHGHITCSAGGELAFDFTSQPASPHIEQYLKRKGFVDQETPGRYVYRPYTRMRKGALHA